MSVTVLKNDYHPTTTHNIRFGEAIGRKKILPVCLGPKIKGYSRNKAFIFFCLPAAHTGDLIHQVYEVLE